MKGPWETVTFPPKPSRATVEDVVAADALAAEMLTLEQKRAELCERCQLSYVHCSCLKKLKTSLAMVANVVAVDAGKEIKDAQTLKNKGVRTCEYCTLPYLYCTCQKVPYK
jgi:hypothetical protein